MKKAVACLFSFVVAAMFAVGCSNPILSSSNEDSGSQKEANSTVNFSVNLAEILQSYQGGLVKTSINGLSASERKDLVTYRLNKVTSMEIVFFQADSPVYQFHFPITSYACEGSMAIDSGHYAIRASLRSSSEISFDWVEKVRIKEGDDTLKICFQETFPVYATIAISNPKGAYTVGRQYPLWFDTASGIREWGMHSAYYTYDVIRGNILTYNVAVTEKGFKGTFTATNDKDDNGQSQTMIFDFNIMNMVWDGYVDLSPKGLTVNASFVMNQPPAIDSVFPTDGATNVPTDIQNIVAYFNKDLADLSDMPGAQFGIASEDGSHQIAGTYGFSANIFSRQLTTTSQRVYLKPNTKYIAHVSAVKDEYGNEMVGEKRWSFTTGS